MKKSAISEATDELRTIFTCLLVVFVVEKLNGVIDWSWWWVLAPFWIPAGIALIYIGVLYSVIFATKRSRRRLINERRKAKELDA